MNPAPTHTFRRSMYALLLTVAAAMAGGRILGAARLYEPYLFRPPADTGDRRPDWPARRPKPMVTLGANDRSRWVTIRALVDSGTYVIGYRDPASASAENKYGDQGIMTEEGWETIDKVLRPDNQRFYSSKPPLLPTVVAGEYWLLKSVFGWSIVSEQSQVVKAILFTVNWLPFVAYLWVLALVAERLGMSDWGRLYVFAAGSFATFLTPFLITLNNHSVAACSVMFAVYSTLQLWRPCRIGADSARVYSHTGIMLPALGAGFFAGVAACTELPATALAAGLFVLLFLRGPRSSLPYFICGLAVPVAAFCVTNYLAIGQFMPAYGEREGPWYQYEGSYWNQPVSVRQGIDWAQEDKLVYAFHLLVGHHGLFSLSPIFVLSAAGVAIVVRKWWRALRYNQETAVSGRDAGGWFRQSIRMLTDLSALGFLTCAVTLIVFGFYVISTNNYGGWTSGPRWLMWLSPLFLVMLLPAADAVSPSRAGRLISYVLLGISVASVSYPAWNPWRHPWLYDFLEGRGAIGY